MNSIYLKNLMSNSGNNAEKSWSQKVKEKFFGASDGQLGHPRPPSMARADTDAPPISARNEDDFRKIRDSIMLLAEGIDIVARNNRLFVENNLSKQELVKLRNDHDILSRKHKDLEKKLEDSTTELLGANESARDNSKKIEKLESDNAAHEEKIRQLEKDAIAHSVSKELSDSCATKLQAELKSLTEEVKKISDERDASRKELDISNSNAASFEKRLNEIIGLQSLRLSYYVPASILQSNVGEQVLAFDEAVTCGDLPSMRVMAGLSQLKAAFIPGSIPEDRLVAVNAIGAALYSAWSSQSKDAKTIHALFTQWQDFLNDLPSAGFRLVVPDLGQNVPQNVTAPAGVTKVSEVHLWIVKGETGGLYSRGIVI